MTRDELNAAIKVAEADLKAAWAAYDIVRARDGVSPHSPEYKLIGAVNRTLSDLWRVKPVEQMRGEVAWHERAEGGRAADRRDNPDMYS